MAGSSNFLQFNPNNQNSEDDIAYLNDTTRTGGITKGEAPVALYNKLFYQQSTLAAAIAQLAANRGQNVSDVNLNALITALDSAFPNSLAQVNSDWNATSGSAQILNKPALTTPNAINSGNVDSSGNPNVLSIPGSGQIVNVSLPTFTNITEATSGKNGVTINPSAAYAIIGLNTAYLGGYDVSSSDDFSVYIDLGQKATLESFTYFCGGRTNITYPACLRCVFGSNDNTNWTPLFTSPSGNSAINFSGQTISGTYRYIRFQTERQSGAGTNAPMGIGGINLIYEATVSSGSTITLAANTTITDYARVTKTLATAAVLSATNLQSNALYNIFTGTDGAMEAFTQAQYGKDFYCDFSQGKAVDNYGLHNITVGGTPSYANNDFGTNTGAAYFSIPFTTLGTGTWCMQGKFGFNETTTEKMLVCTTNATNGYGLQLRRGATNKLYVRLSGDGSSNSIASDVYGTKSDWSTSVKYYIRIRFTGTQYLVDWSTDYNPLTGLGTWINDITVNNTATICSPLVKIGFGFNTWDNSLVLNGTIDDAQVTIGDSVCRMRNRYTIGKTALLPVAGDILYNTSVEPAIMQKYNGSTFETYNKVPCGQFTTNSSGVITSISQPVFNDSKYVINSDIIARYGMPSNKCIALTLGDNGTPYVAQADGYFEMTHGALNDVARFGLLNTNNNLSPYIYANGPNPFSVFVPAKKGDIVKILYDTSTYALSFIPAEGSK